MSTDNAWWRSKIGGRIALEYSWLLVTLERILRKPPPPPPKMAMSYPMFLRYNLAVSPNDDRAPLWRAELERERIKSMKERMRGGWWPWSAGPKGRLP